MEQTKVALSNFDDKKYILDDGYTTLAHEHYKSMSGGAFFAISSTGYFSGKCFFEGHSSGQTGSNDTSFEFVSCLRAEKKGGHTDRQILSIIYVV